MSSSAANSVATWTSRRTIPLAEVERLLSLGARRTDVGQTGREGFEVLVDPEGNEFCVLGVHHQVTAARRPDV